ncbi:DEAD/DEAH box helicase [Kitasatospora sp. NBC_01302]|uniref:DEAD/DEAH box helicase n=1 Tax=Kitasatospora sp. NBC_01302 TaxID=2903575 RepID=UPI002E137DD6|nr:Helicase associated domain protein [Kitasatospora sp. NBC_01302]
MSTTVQAGPQLRGYQQEAVAAITEALAGGGVRQLRMACGTGKSLTAQRAAEALLAAELGQGRNVGVVAVVTPSLALVKQFVDGWRHNADIGPVQCLAVCSDRTIGQHDEMASVADLDAQVTTDVDVIKRRLHELPSDGLLLIVSTYVSVAVLARGVQAAGRALDVLICDEAHHLAGNPATSLRNLVSDPDWLPAARRIYMTATPRLYTSRLAGRGALSMDDPLFGKVAYEYAFPKAIADGHLDDYRALVTVVENEKVRRILELLDEARDSEPGEARNTVVAQVALLRSWQEQGVGRAIAFCDSIRGSKVFTAQLRQVAAMLGYDPDMVTALHVDGSMSSEQRAPILAELAAPSDGRLVVVSNARCLGEGVDVPSVDAVLFACPKRSEVDIIQSAGRALRRSPGGRGVAKFILPMMLPEAPDGDLPSNVLDGTDYEPAWTVIRALRDLDNDLGAELDQLRTSAVREPEAQEADDSQQDGLPDRIAIAGPCADPEILRQIAVALIDHTTAPWLDGYAALKAFHDEAGHLNVPAGAKLADGSFLKRWIARQRSDRLKGILPFERVAALDALGFEWDAETAAWWRMYEFFAGSERGTEGFAMMGRRYWKWVEEQQDAYADATLSQERIAALNGCGFDWVPLAVRQAEMEAAREVKQRAAREAVAAWLAEHGCANLPGRVIATDIHGNEVDIVKWLEDVCRRRHWGELGPEEGTAIAAMGFDWLPPWWRQYLERVAAFHATFGHVDIPREFENPVREGVFDQSLSSWLNDQRRDANRGDLAPEQAAALNELGVGWVVAGPSRSEAAADWMETAELAVKYFKDHGDLRVPLHFRADVPQRYPCYLGCWLQVQRQRRADGTLTGASAALLEALGIDWDVDWDESSRARPSAQRAAA